MTIAATTLTTQRVIRLAYKDAGLLQDGDEPSSEQYMDGIMRLNDLVNLWQTQGLKLWLQVDQEIPLVEGDGSYTLGPSGDVDMVKPLRVSQAYFLSAAGARRPVNIYSREEFTRLSSPTSEGPVNSVFVDKQQLSLVVSFWMIPDATAATGTVHLILQTQATNVGSLTDNDAFPVEWALALRWGLADELATGQPQSIMTRCETRAKAYREALEDWDVEDASTYFAPSRNGR